jgi:BirA family biotin operon repressor/biotin-[acetyl-CoA-carboxylase] ligase
VVIGIGLNVSLSAESRRVIEADEVPVAALSDACPAAISRNGLAAALMEELLMMLSEFENRGFAAFRRDWSALDGLLGRAARLHLAQGTVEGIARGVDADGALLLEVGGRLQRYVSGEVSLRLIDGAS